MTENKQTKATKKAPVKKEKKLLPFQDEAQLRDMHLKQKMTAMDIANKFGVKRHNVLFYLHKYNIPIWSRKEKEGLNRSYRKKQWLEKQLKSGLSIHKIALSCGVGYMQVKNYCFKYGLISLVEQQRAKAKIKKEAPKKKIKK